MKKLHYYPALPKNGQYANPYSHYYRKALSKYFKIVDTSAYKGVLLPFLLACSALFKADIYLFNWIESFGYRYLKALQYMLIILCFRIIKCRKKRLVWMFHNMHPHAKNGKYSSKIMDFLFKHADLIIAHSKEAAEYVQSKAKFKVLYRCHPVPSSFELKTSDGNITPIYDVLIWGTVLPYKGIAEFLSYLTEIHSQLKVYVIGKCNDELLTQSINSLCSDYINFSNRHVDFQELSKLISQSRYVVFPYIGTSVSSSGALIDTVAMGGNAIGPNKGAFKDLADEGCCCVYDNYEELVNIVERNIKPDSEAIRIFLQKNSWENYVKSIVNEL